MASTRNDEQTAEKPADLKKKERAANALRANLRRRKESTQQPVIEK